MWKHMMRARKLQRGPSFLKIFRLHQFKKRDERSSKTNVLGETSGKINRLKTYTSQMQDTFKRNSYHDAFKDNLSASTNVTNKDCGHTIILGETPARFACQSPIGLRPRSPSPRAQVHSAHSSSSACGLRLIQPTLTSVTQLTPSRCEAWLDELAP